MEVLNRSILNPDASAVAPLREGVERKRVSETLSFSALPQPHQSKKRFEQTRSKVITCCVDADAAWNWWSEIHDKTFEELYTVGGQQFERADLLSVGAITHIYQGELGTYLTNLTVECATKLENGTRFPHTRTSTHEEDYGLVQNRRTPNGRFLHPGHYGTDIRRKAT